MPKHTKISLREIPPKFDPHLQQTLDQLSNWRGEESLQKVIEALRILSGTIKFQVTEKYSPDDCNGIDIIITIFSTIKQENRFKQIEFKKIQAVFPLQIKSSLAGARKFSGDKQNEIPVLVRRPGATEKQIIKAFQHLVRLYNPFAKNHKKGIIVIAG